jgi:serine/threonine protein kinase
LLERELSAHSPGYSPPKLRGGKRDSKVTRGTLFNIANGKPVLLETARVLATLFGMEDVSRILAKGELPPVGPPGTWGEERGPFYSLADWEPDQLLGVLPRKPHGIESELWKVRHRFVPGRVARGKLYLTDTLSAAERNRIREYLVRHADVCNRLSGNPAFPRNITCSPDSNNQTWWVVDEWIEGETLEDRLAAGDLNPRDSARILTELAAALHDLHENGIVRRDLSPEDILLREGDDAVVLTDFELSKVLEGRPTVAPADWWERENPLRAPEVGSPDSTLPAVDLYSWGRLLVRLVTGEYPSSLGKPLFAEKTGISKALGDLVVSCIAVDRSKRPKSFVPVLAALEKWKPR